MIEQYLSNTNKYVTIPILQFFLELNKALAFLGLIWYIPFKVLRFRKYKIIVYNTKTYQYNSTYFKIYHCIYPYY